MRRSAWISQEIKIVEERDPLHYSTWLNNSENNKRVHASDVKKRGKKQKERKMEYIYTKRTNRREISRIIPDIETVNEEALISANKVRETFHERGESRSFVNFNCNIITTSPILIIGIDPWRVESTTRVTLPPPPPPRNEEIEERDSQFSINCARDIEARL